MPKGRIPYIQLAQKDILRFFEDSNSRVFSESQLAELLNEHRDKWRLPQSMTPTKFITFLKVKGKLLELFVSSPKEPESPIVRYGWGKVLPFEVALSLKSKAYLTHASAAFLHGLSDQLPHRIFVNFEQTPKHYSKGTLSQEAIHSAFKNEQRESSLHYFYNDFDIQVLNGKHTGGLEVGSINFEGKPLATTKLERTLIDLVVRPVYGGGVYEVLKAYVNAKSHIALPVLLATLKKLDFIYPYHQAIGFYMEHAGYPKDQYEQLKAFGLEYEFYLAHGLRETRFVPEWLLFVPKGL